MHKPIPYKGAEPYIFISYAHKDAQRVWPIIDRLIRDGYRVWYDEGIDPGTEWDEFIANHIEHCSCFLAFLSANYMASDNCKDELNFVRDLNKSRLLIYLESGVELPSGMRMRLGRLQAIHWYTYDNPADAFAKLYSAEELGQLLAPGSPAPQPAPALTAPERFYEQGEIFYRVGLFREAATEYTCAAELGHAGAQFRLGYLCHLDQNHPQSFHWYLQAAQQGHKDAQYETGWNYAFGRGVEQDTVKALEWFQKAGDQGIADAYFQMGKLYMEGEYPAYLDAALWFKKAASLGHPEGDNQADLASQKFTVRLEISRLRPKALQGDFEAQYQLGKCLSSIDWTEAVTWYQKAAQQGHPDAQCELGLCYYLGRGLSEDQELAHHWWEQAALQGHPRAQYNLSDWYKNAWEPEDSEEDYYDLAMYWLRKSADQGYAMAQFFLGWEYEEGQDWKQAINWYQLSAAQGCHLAQQRLEELGFAD